ncbi:MAG TPA: hypothetical protein VL595_27655 [Pseudonocardia sp.]|nr:hypothetical protein [Pseudonocardia sp.]
MAQALQDLAGELFVDPEEILALLLLYPGDESDLWEADGVLSAEAVEDVSRMLNQHADSVVPERYLERPTGRYPLPARIAWVAGSPLVHRGSIETGSTRCGERIAGRDDGVTVTDEPLCPRCFPAEY